MAHQIKAHTGDGDQGDQSHRESDVLLGELRFKKEHLA